MRRLLAALVLVAFLATPARSQERVIVAFGDSLTAGQGVPAAQSYPALLAARLRAEGYPYRVVNAGVSGDTTAGGLRRGDWAPGPGPGVVALGLGVHDRPPRPGLGTLRPHLTPLA